VWLLLALCVAGGASCPFVRAAGDLLAGVGKVEITDRTGPVNDPCFAKALVLKRDGVAVVLITVDAVAIGEIGRIGNDFLPNVRTQLERDLGIPPASVVINASHCHGLVRPDTEALTVQAVQAACRDLVPVKVGTTSGKEDRISENRRLKMKDGSEVDMRRAYSLPRDEDVAEVGPIDPQIGIVRLDRLDGRPLALLYNFACHPIMNPPSKGCSADFPGFASRLIEETLGEGAVAFFVQGCAGDINPVRYKEVSRPADAEPLGTLLGASVLRAARQIQTVAGGALEIHNETLTIPRGADFERRIAAIESEQARLLKSIKQSNLNFKSFLPLFLEQRVWPEFPSHNAQSYLHDRALGREQALAQMDADNRAGVEAYLANLDVMEKLMRLNANLALLKKHLDQTKAAGKPTLDVEVAGVRIGDFKLVTFPGELTVRVGLKIKQAVNDPNACVAGYCNGYIYYTPTVAQRKNSGYAQEDCDSLVAPEWEDIFEAKALEVLKSL
jgi:hypothetical protein